MCCLYLTSIVYYINSFLLKSDAKIATFQSALISKRKFEALSVTDQISNLTRPRKRIQVYYTAISRLRLDTARGSKSLQTLKQRNIQQQQK